MNLIVIGADCSDSKESTKAISEETVNLKRLIDDDIWPSKQSLCLDFIHIFDDSCSSYHTRSSLESISYESGGRYSSVPLDSCNEAYLKLLFQRHIKSKLKTSDALINVQLSTGWEAKSIFTRKSGLSYIMVNELRSDDAYTFAIVPDTKTEARFRVSIPSYQVTVFYNDSQGRTRMRILSGRMAKSVVFKESIGSIQFDALLTTVLRDALHTGRAYRYEEIIPTLLYHARAILCLFSDDSESSAWCLACETDTKAKLRVLLRYLLALCRDAVFYKGSVGKPIYSNINSFSRLNADFIQGTVIGNLFDVTDCGSNDATYAVSLVPLPLSVTSMKTDGIFLLTLYGNKGFIWIGAGVSSVWCLEQFGLPSVNDTSIKIIESILLRDKNLSPLSKLLRSLDVLFLRVVVQGSTLEWIFNNKLVDDEDQGYNMDDIVSVAHKGCRVRYRDCDV